MKKAIILFIAMFLFGCSYRVPPRLNIHIETQANEFEANAIIDSMYEGFDKLLNCEYLQEKYPDAYRRLVILQTDIRVQHIKNIHDAVRLCGRARIGGNVVELSPGVYYSDRCSVLETIPHEILHLIGFTHDEDVEGDCEEFYHIFWQCKF